MQPHWSILFRQKFQTGEKTWELHKEYYVPVQPYIGLVLRDGELILLVSEATWDVRLKKFTVDNPNCPMTPDNVEKTVGLYKSHGWKLQDHPGVVWEK